MVVRKVAVLLIALVIGHSVMQIPVTGDATNFVTQMNTSGWTQYYTHEYVIMQSFETPADAQYITGIDAYIESSAGSGYCIIGVDYIPYLYDSDDWLAKEQRPLSEMNGWEGFSSLMMYSEPSTTHYVYFKVVQNSYSYTAGLSGCNNCFSDGQFYYCSDGETWHTMSRDLAFIVRGLTITANEAPITPQLYGDVGEIYDGCFNTQYSFQVHAWDPDENEQLEYYVDWGDGHNTGWVAFTNEYNDDGYTKAYASISHIWTSEATTIQIISRDDSDSESPTRYVSCGIYNHDPVLSAGEVSPELGDEDTMFTFSVRYSDCDTDIPTNKVCYYRVMGYSWSNEQMTAGTGSYLDGKIFTLSRQVGSLYGVGTGDCQYYFYFDDGNGNTATTETKTFELSTNHEPTKISSESILINPSTFYRGTEVTFKASTTDEDSDMIRYGWDWDSDDTVDDWTGYYSSGAQCSQTHTFGYNDFDGVSGETLPTYMQVKAEDEHGLSSDFRLKTISLQNNGPNSTAIVGPTNVGNATTRYFNVTITDPETDQMTVRYDWGDGTSDYTTGWNDSGFVVSVPHTYTGKGTKTITCTITDEFDGSRVITKSVTIKNAPDYPDNIQSYSYNSKFKITWSIPLNNGGEPVSSYGIKYWNASAPGGEDSAVFVYNISYLNASQYLDTGHNISGLDNGQQYNFRMSANNSFGISSWSDTYNNTPGHTDPTAPIINTLPEYSDSALDLKWASPTFYDGAVVSLYHILYSSDGTNYTEKGTTASRQYHFTSLTNGVTYYFKVYVVDNQSGQSPLSSYKSTTIDNSNPSEPILDELPTYIYTKVITVSWSASEDDESGVSYYEVQEDDSTTFGSPSNTYEGSSTEATFYSNHDFGKTYYYRVRAVDNAGNPSEWNGPVQTMVRTNSTTGTEYSKITEIWFKANSLVINIPIIVTITVEDKYTIPSGYVHYIVSGEQTEMRVSRLSGGYYKFAAVWEPQVSGSVDFSIKVVNSNNAASYVTIPVDVLASNRTTKPTIKIFETSDEDVISVTFSSKEYNVSSYQDELNIYHVSFGTDANEIVILDITDLDMSVESGYLWFIRVSWLDSRKLEAIVHGARKGLYYKFEYDGTYMIQGYNDWQSKYFSWLPWVEKEFELVEEKSNYMVLSSLSNTISISK